MNIPEQTTEPIEIEKLVYGGDGLGRLASGEVVFVPWSVPGDQLLIQKLPGTQKPTQGRIASVSQPSTDRIQPQCSVFGICGGCQWQQVAPNAQREWKRRIVAESLTRIGKLPDITVPEVLGQNDAQWHFRNRVQWEVQWNTRTNRHELGYLQAGSHDVVAFETCHIIPSALNDLARWLQDYFARHAETAAALQRIEVMQNADGQILLSAHGHMETTLAEALAQTFPAVTGIVAFKPKQKSSGPELLYGQPFLVETVLGKQYQVSAGSFFQTNRTGTELVLNTLSEWMSSHTDSLLDLYAGVGLFALHFQDKAKRITALESSPHTVEDARENAKRHGVSHIDWLTGDAGKLLKSLRTTFETAIIDPPRSGCQPDVLDWLSRHVTKQLLYVSCNPTTLARDLKTLTEAGWHVEAVQPIDMFPQTYHVETVAHLVR